MSTLFSVALLILLLIPLGIVIRRSTELFVLRVGPPTKPDGRSTASSTSRTRFIRGRIPPSLLRDLREVLDASEAQGTLRVVIERGLPVLSVRGHFSDDTQQRVRNVVGLFPVAKLKAGVRPSSRK